MWKRELDVLMPLWQGADDVRVREGAAALGALTTSSVQRVVIPVPVGPSPRQNGVRHQSAVTTAVRTQREVFAQHNPGRLLTLGGDCTVEVASVAHLARRHGERLFIVWIDAHADLNTPATSPSGTAHGMPLRMLLEDDPESPLATPGCVQSGQVALVGTRDLDPAEEEYVDTHAMSRLDVSGLSEAPARLGELPPPGAAVYIHLDLDVLDPAALPAVAVPTTGGLAPTTLAQALSALQASHDVVGVGVTEYVPQIEHDPQVLAEVLGALGLTATAAAADGEG